MNDRSCPPVGLLDKEAPDPRSLDPALGLLTYEAAGHVPIIDASAFVHPTAVLIGDVHICADCYIGPNVTIRGDQGSILVGPRTNIQDNCVLHTAEGGRLMVGPDGQIGHGATLHGCEIADDVLVGIRAIVLDGAYVGHGSIIGAGSVVLAGARIRSGYVAVGSPCTLRREVTESDRLRKRRVTAQYVQLARGRVGGRWAPAQFVRGSPEHAVGDVRDPWHATPAVDVTGDPTTT